VFLFQDIFEWDSRRAPVREVAKHISGDVLTLGGLESRANRIAWAFIEAGLNRGDRVAVLAKNCLDYLALYLASAKAGVVLLPLNYRLTPAELVYIINDADTRALIVRGAYTDTIVSIRSELPTVELFAVIDHSVPPGFVAFADWIAQQSDRSPNLELDSQDEVVQMYTSGTTGLPKGVVLSHQNLVASMFQTWLCGTTPAGIRMQVITPMYHVAASCGCFLAIALGGSIFVHEDFDAEEVVRVLEDECIGMTFMPPAVIQALLVAIPDIETRNFDHLQKIMYGAAPITETTLRRGMEVFGCEFGQGYGQTEIPLLTYLSPEDHLRALSGEKPELLRSAGRAIPATHLKIVDEVGNELPPYSSGEILGRGPQSMLGFWKKPEENDAVLRNGWVHTGDVGYLDDEGYLFLQDRLKDMIVSGGENVYPAEVEQALYEHSAVADVAVIGIPDERWGESVHAIIQLRAGADATSEELLAFCRERLAGYKCPRSVDFTELIPRNASGKILKKDLRIPYWEGRTRNVN
jgi:acyl-CoA synthetase (AMP-forming)/AMP-acid ligase II